MRKRRLHIDTTRFQRFTRPGHAVTGARNKSHVGKAFHHPATELMPV